MGPPRTTRPPVIDALQLAHLFLTRLPLGDAGTVTAARFAPALVAFPLVGLTVAGAGALGRIVADPLGPVVACITAVAATVLVTGAFHEDGLADTADALGPHGRTDRLAAMRDARLGTFGVLALVLATGARVGLLAQISLRDCILALAAGHVLGRGSTLVLAVICSPARADGATLLVRPSTRQALLGSILAVGLALPALVAIAPAASVAVLASALVIIGSALLWRRAFGGVTGDTFGATNQLVEIVVYITIVSSLASTL